MQQNNNLIIKNLYTQLEKEPENIKLNTVLLYVNKKQGDLDKALVFCENILKIEPNNYIALYEQAHIFILKNQYILACKNYQKIYQNYKDKYKYLKNWCECLLLLNNKKYINKFELVCIELLNRFKQDNNDIACIYCYEQLILINSNKIDNYHLKNLYIKTKQYAKAEQILKDEIAQSPENAALWVNYAAFLHDTDRLIEAKDACNKAISLDANYYYAYDRLSFVLKELHDVIGSKNAVLKCLDLNKTESSLFHLATIELLLGNYQTGWPLYKYNNSVAKPNTPHFIPEILFDGTQDLNNKVLCVWLDLGLGDAIKFMRYIPMLAELVSQKGGKMVCSIFSEFNDLFQKNYNQYFSEISNRFYKPYEEFDYQIQLSRLPELFKTTLDTIPNKIPYLQPSDKALIKHKDIFKNDKNFKVGLVWAGNKNHARDHLRSIGVDSYIPFKDIADISFYGFQFGKVQDIEYAHNQGLNIIDLTANIKNFDESAAIFQQLDLLITVDTSACHLAGALGVATWLLVDVAPHYVWLLERADSPWYPNTIIYRQTEYKNWQPVLQKLHQDLKEKVEKYHNLNTNSIYQENNQITQCAANSITQIYSLAIVIITVCRLSLIRAVKSIFDQNYTNNIQLLIGIDIDINNNYLMIKQILDNECPKNIKIVWLNLGYSTSKRHGGIHSCYYGGSLRTVLSMLANSEFVMYLDDDDWLDKAHVSSILNVIGDNSWAFAYSIYADGNQGIGICTDELESVGVNKGVFAQSHGGFVRPSGLLINKIKLMHILHLWSCSPFSSGDGEDRLIFEKLRYEPYACTQIPSVYYTLDPKDGMHNLRMEFIESKTKTKNLFIEKIGSVR